MSFSFLGTCAAVIVFTACVFAPFYFWHFDPLAVPVSIASQMVVFGGISLLPISLPWLIYEAVVSRALKPEGVPTTRYLRFWFAVVLLVLGSLLGFLCCLLVLLGVSAILGAFMLSCLTACLAWLVPKLRRFRGEWSSRFMGVPAQLVCIPTAVLLLQFLLVKPVSNASREHAIANAQRFIDDIESFRRRHGEYPVSLIAQWKDYHPGVLGVDKFHYHRHGDAYSLSFEQPKLLIDQPGTREWVVFNPRDQHQSYSHTSFFLLLPPEEHERSPGWYAVDDSAVAQWKIFFFD